MSRSRRKHPVVSDQQHRRGTKKLKRFANRDVRNAPDVPNGKAYRKYHCSWNICDYKSYCTPRDLEKYEWLGKDKVYRK